MNQKQQQTNYNQARASLQQAISWYSSFRRHWNHPPNATLQGAVKQDLQSLKSALEKLDRVAITIATFGLVSRGKSAVVNALVGQKVLPTGPIHGLTKWPKSISWTPPTGKVQVELIDTPGLDEIDGQQREEMAKAVARQSDLILFVVSGDITRTEYLALLELREAQKPLILVFNKIDLYPEKDRQEIYQQLQKLGQDHNNNRLNSLLSKEEIVMIAAEPQALQIRVEYPDGKDQLQWETPAPQIEQLQEKILTILNREGQSLLALNSLIQARDAQLNIAKKTIEIRQEEAEKIIWKYAQYKALVVAANPIAFIDIIGGIIWDLAAIRALARLYGLPLSSYQAGKLWKTIFASSGGLILGEIFGSLVLGIGKTAAAATSVFENPTALATYATSALTQGCIAGYGTYAVAKVAQTYLQQGCTWGPLGSNTIIKEILDGIDSNTIIYRLKQELF